MAEQKQDDQHEHTFSNYVRIQDVVLKTCLGRWTIGKSGERGSGISVLPARHDDDDICYEHSMYVSHIRIMGMLHLFIIFNRIVWRYDVDGWMKKNYMKLFLVVGDISKLFVSTLPYRVFCMDDGHNVYLLEMNSCRLPSLLGAFSSDVLPWEWFSCLTKAN